jgi:hypothetical protein
MLLLLSFFFLLDNLLKHLYNVHHGIVLITRRVYIIFEVLRDVIDNATAYLFLRDIGDVRTHYEEDIFHCDSQRVREKVDQVHL